MALISLIILTRDEEANLSTCLESLKGLDAEVFVVDSGSIDNTLSIASAWGCHVYSHEWVNHGEQVNWAIENLPFNTPWSMRLDADERLTSDLVDELNTKLVQSEAQISGYLIKRRVFFMGRWIRFGGYYPTWLLRVWRTGHASCESRYMDEHMVLSKGSLDKLHHDLIDENLKGLNFWINKHNRYSELEIQDIIDTQSEANLLLGSNNGSQPSQRRWVKQNLYFRSPLFLRALIYFLMRYVIGLGFLDGIPGLIFHVFQGFWYRFLIDAKLYEKMKFEKIRR
ncbi:glycosyltransferase family 2 protein [Nodosilinea sp. LEGE 07088]|uniref:glycosyltransferase family 2 protein n=1 Tax=Nodosilinea sp. LEGE 07088 TaxID=2777968 RepID=UPI001881DF91|nr:glycosyltransferase family 2 protein [Nodosilinea sp. LEGE 07088]MBE9135941.1 glycosyltransferase family 2 protein [Nodosilinea sp. LEGE 07088]